jgi:hypothetical protein
LLYPMRELQRQFTAVQDDFDNGLITQAQVDLINARLLQIKFPTEQITEPVVDVQDKIGALQADLSRAGNAFVETFSTSLVDSLLEGGKSFKEFTKDALKGFAKMILQAVIFNTLMGAIGGTAFGQKYGIGTQPATPRTRGPAGPDRRFIGVLTAPTYGYGSQGAAAASGGVVVNIQNNAPVDVQVKQRESGGGIEIDMMIQETVNKAIASGGLDRTLNSSYGIRRRAF